MKVKKRKQQAEVQKSGKNLLREFHEKTFTKKKLTKTKNVPS